MRKGLKLPKQGNFHKEKEFKKYCGEGGMRSKIISFVCAIGCVNKNQVRDHQALR